MDLLVLSAHLLKKRFVCVTVKEINNWFSIDLWGDDLQGIIGIPGSENWKKIELINKGWSEDKKYYVLDQNDDQLLLRISDIANYELKKYEFEAVKLFNQFDFPMSRAIEVGKSNDNQYTYMILTWLEGTPLEDCIHSFSEQKQYEFGAEAGRYLRKIHSIPIKDDLSQWEKRMKDKILKRMKDYKASPYRADNDERFIKFVKEHIDLMKEVPKVYQHGDFHIGNLLYTSDGRIGVIDFNRWDMGDFAEEFYKVQAFDREISIPFAKGKIDGYFGGNPGEEFWRRHALYVAYSSLYSILWTVPFGTNSIKEMVGRFELARDDYDDFNRLIPKWYAN